MEADRRQACPACLRPVGLHTGLVGETSWGLRLSLSFFLGSLGGDAAGTDSCTAVSDLPGKLIAIICLDDQHVR